MRRKLTIIIAGTIILMALSFIWLRLKSGVPKFDNTLAAGIGEALAAQVVEAVKEHGTVVTVVYGNPSEANSIADPRLEVFHNVLKKHDGIHIASPEIVQPNPNETGLPGCPPTAFQEILRRHTGAAIVFFMDVPEWSRTKSAFQQGDQTKLIVLVTGGLQFKLRYDDYFRNGLLAALLIPRREFIAGPTPETPRDQFDRHYQIFTAQDFESLPD